MGLFITEEEGLRHFEGSYGDGTRWVRERRVGPDGRVMEDSFFRFDDDGNPLSGGSFRSSPPKPIEPAKLNPDIIPELAEALFPKTNLGGAAKN